ncbi:flavo protein [Dothidotthia symphoricarpi CBS 119687]|uniref:Flavo protein n=1 Tax=Dothidotthia symphoricarpi CBS 119687 TaxID=1392245 RepID=A0A6A5ZW21_9PLEO|nr:flavo protein [Dothidotthia symphoricarpi CBS 119687]KAF2123932.1 flavo protein [Dothidotthia symphoricarpi CBS 119687]
MPSQCSKRSLNVLVALTDPSAFKFSCSVVALLHRLEHVSLRIIAANDFPAAAHATIPPHLEPVWFTYDIKNNTAPGWQHVDFIETKVAEYCSWADLLVLAPLDAENLARMLHGFTNNLHLQILRSWDVSKKVLLIPGMSTLMWENPTSKKQMGKIRRKWNWIRVLSPYLWTFDHLGRYYYPWDGHKAFNDFMQTQIDLMAVGDRTIALPIPHLPTLTPTKSKGPRLPPELWSIILEFTKDWELATALNVHTNLPVPQEWRQAASEEGPKTQMQRLEWALLTYSNLEINKLFDQEEPTRISRLCIELIMRFAMLPVLRHLENHHKDLFWGTFGHAFLPHKASVFGKPEILEYWRTSPTFLTKEYSPEAMDNASRANSLRTLDWWYASGLPLKYTEASLEQASSQGHIQVLEWWQSHSRYRTATPSPTTTTTETTEPPPPPPPPDTPKPPLDLPLKVGKSITYATQSGSLPAINFWVQSTIPFAHEDTIAKLASTHGHTHILAYWRELRGEKMLFDTQVLVGPTKMGYAHVLEWWKRSGLRVEYKTCDIEEALEDGVEGVRGEEVRRWWALNGLNLGVGTSEWMRIADIK